MPVVSFRSSSVNAALSRFRRVRGASIAMCASLSSEEYRLQPMEDVSPPWWNLGHTSWFFVRNVLQPFGGRIEPEDAQYDFLLNSYYVSLGERISRDARGMVSRPTTDEIFCYRASVDQRVIELVDTIDDDHLNDLISMILIGTQHEQQHQELFYTEIKSIRHQNILNLREPYTEHAPPELLERLKPIQFQEFGSGLFEFGNCEGGWCWDNELPLHLQYLAQFALADRLVTNAEYLEFMEDGGYSNPLLWLDNGWRERQSQGWCAPLYWERVDGQWWNWTLNGMRPVAEEEPVCHVSFYEADAFARWKDQNFVGFRNVRLPTEREWEQAARLTGAEVDDDAFADSGHLHPVPAKNHGTLRQMSGCLWQWMTSYYEPYPGYTPYTGTLVEYNSKFMDNQRVLRGGSCVTPHDHFRISYRNFWKATTRFQFSGIRLARSI
jgi:ergothioneine biosynthesis protein EgtB